MCFKKTLGMLACLGLFVGTSAMAAVQSKTIVYKHGGETFEGILVYPDTLKAKTPALLLVHNWMGVTAETKTQAERFAQLGYIVFGADVYGQGVRPKGPEEAGKLAGRFKGDRKLLRERLNAALDTLKKQPNVDADRLAAMGYCFGGTSALELARSGADIKGAMSFHGGLDSPTPSDGAKIKAHVLALHGADDPYVKAEDLAAFENELRAAKVDWQLVKYSGAVHSFTEKSAGSDNSKGAAYNETADRRSFADAQQFLKEIL